MDNIYLIGMMGSGKSVTARKLAGILGARAEDFDDAISKKSGCSIVEIFSGKGEAYFRDLEAEVLAEMARKRGQVIATGGGIVLRPENVRTMRETGRVVYLETSLDELFRRVGDKKDRPLLLGEAPRERLAKIFAQRKRLYENACDLSVNTDGRTALDVANEIREKIGDPR